MSFGTDTERENKDEHLWHYLTALNRLVVEKLKDEKAPLVVAGVEFELAIYQRVNTYQNTCEQMVRGAANGLKGGELHTRALEALSASDETRVDSILRQHDKQSAGLADADVAGIVKAAYEGRVATLIVSRDGQAFGNFDEATHRVRQHKNPITGDEDLINAAAMQTILHAGDVLVVAPERVPGGRALAAVMRY